MIPLIVLATYELLVEQFPDLCVSNIYTIISTIQTEHGFYIFKYHIRLTTDKQQMIIVGWDQYDVSNHSNVFILSKNENHCDICFKSDEDSLLEKIFNAVTAITVDNADSAIVPER